MKFTIIKGLPYYYKKDCVNAETGVKEDRIYPCSFTPNSVFIDDSIYKVVLNKLPVYTEFEVRAKIGNIASTIVHTTKEDSNQDKQVKSKKKSK